MQLLSLDPNDGRHALRDGATNDTSGQLHKTATSAHATHLSRLLTIWKTLEIVKIHQVRDE